MKDIKVIAFDADDTLWGNEEYFRESEAAFENIIKKYTNSEHILATLLDVEIKNLPIYGYGVKGFVLSMLDTALELTDKQLSIDDVQAILQLGKDQLSQPVHLIDGVESALEKLSKHYRLVVATKGDLLDQENKLKQSGLEKYFHHIEIVSEKHEEQYRKLVKHLDIEAHQFMMVGNSMRSDIMPVLGIGAWACHIPYATVWQHEVITDDIKHPKLLKVDHAKDLVHQLLHL